MSKRNIQYVKNDEPSFITKFKKNVGYKEGPTVDTKREELSRDDSGSDEDDEKPTVVVLKKGDISQEEYDSLTKDAKDKNSHSIAADSVASEREEDEPPADGKIVFKKPTKRSTDSSELNVSTKKKKDSSKNTDKKDKDKSKGVKNKQLLSFDDDEEDEED